MDYMDSVKIDLCEHWKFHLGEKEEAWYKGFDDSGWEEVTLPHDWSVGLPFSESNSSGTGYLSGGIGWYRVRFSLPEEYRGKRYGCCLTGFIKIVRYGATVIIWENVRTDMFLLIMTSAKRYFSGKWIMRSA